MGKHRPQEGKHEGKDLLVSLAWPLMKTYWWLFCCVTNSFKGFSIEILQTMGPSVRAIRWEGEWLVKSLPHHTHEWSVICLDGRWQASSGWGGNFSKISILWHGLVRASTFSSEFDLIQERGHIRVFPFVNGQEQTEVNLNKVANIYVIDLRTQPFTETRTGAAVSYYPFRIDSTQQPLYHMIMAKGNMGTSVVHSNCLTSES